MTSGVQSLAIDKGKGKERERDPSTPAGQTPGAGNEGEEEESQVKGEKKWRNNYKHLIKDIPGACYNPTTSVLGSLYTLPLYLWTCSPWIQVNIR